MTLASRGTANAVNLTETAPATQRNACLARVWQGTGVLC